MEFDEPMMERRQFVAEKPWYMSRGVVGGIIAFLAPVISLFGVDIDASDQSNLISGALLIGGAVSGLVSSYGRVCAKDKIKL